jgi:paraquat-inducible protein A
VPGERHGSTEARDEEVVLRHPWVACPDCDLLYRLTSIRRGSTARCRRCRGVLRTMRRNGLERTLALAIAAAVLFVVSNTFPFLAFELKGQVTKTTLLSGVADLYRGGYQELSALVLVTSVLAPLVQIALLIYVLLPMRWNRIPLGVATACRTLRHVQPWSMMEVFLIGMLVSVVKLKGMHAAIVPGTAVWAFALLIVVLTAALASLDLQEVWERVEARR